jgi:hypothetical protein
MGSLVGTLARTDAAPRGIVEPLLAGEMSVEYIQAMPTINLTDDELAAATATVRRASRRTDFLAPRALIRCARRWQSSRQPQSHPILSVIVQLAGDVR